MEGPRVYLAACLILLFPVSGYAQREKVEEILELTGMKNQVIQIPLSIHTGLATHQGKYRSLEAQTFELLDQVVTDSYDQKLIYGSIVNHLMDHYEPDQILALLSLLNSPIARKMSEYEARAARAGTSVELLEYTKHLDANPPTKNRLDLILNLYQAANTTELSAHLQALTYVAMLQAFHLTIPSEKRVDHVNPGELYDAIKGQLMESYDQVAAVIYLYTYRNATDEELINYIRFYQSEPMKWYTLLMQTAIQRTMETAAQRMADQLSKKMLRDSVWVNPLPR